MHTIPRIHRISWLLRSHQQISKAQEACSKTLQYVSRGRKGEQSSKGCHCKGHSPWKVIAYFWRISRDIEMTIRIMRLSTKFGIRRKDLKRLPLKALQLRVVEAAQQRLNHG